MPLRHLSSKSMIVVYSPYIPPPPHAFQPGTAIVRQILAYRRCSVLRVTVTTAWALRRSVTL